MLPESLLKTVIEKILALKKEEKFLLVTDNVKKELAEDFFIYATKNGYNVKIMLMSSLEEHGQEPPKEVAKEMLSSKVIFLLTDKSLSHTEATRKAVKNGTRGISSPNMFKDILERCVDIDYEKLIKFHQWLRPIIKESKEIEVTTELGTKIKFSVTETHGYPEHLLKNQPGAIGNLPTGEVDSGIKNANGKLIIDGSFPYLGLLEEPIELDVKDNYATIVSENHSSKKLKDILDKIGKEAYKLAEFGIGTNPKAQLTGRVIEDEKVLGTVHFALGNDITYGGDNNIPLHLDGVIKKPSIIVDGKIVMEKGKFLDLT
jgi:aminopeptidase